MLKKKLLKKLSLAVGVTTGALAPAIAGAEPTNVSPEILSAMERDLGLPPAQALQRLAREAEAASAEGTLRQDLGAAFGGAWLDADGRLVVGITDAALASRVRQAGAEPRMVTWSERQLDMVKSALDRNAARANRSIHGWYVDTATNSVVVLAEARAQASAKAFAAELGADSKAVQVEVSNEAPRPLYDTRGGDAYYAGGGRCSIGFSVWGGFVTAGHCGGVGTTTYGFNWVTQGTVRGSSFPGNDHAWVQSNGSWASQPWVNSYLDLHGNILVTGSQEAVTYSTVCRSGSTTGWRCGYISAKNVTVNYAQGAVFGLTRSTACAEPGDSGGSWLHGNQAQGVTSGGSGNCTSGGTTYFQPINPILNAYGLTLMTSGSSDIVGLAGKCMDVSNSSSASGTAIQLWDCNGTSAQRWSFAADGSIQALGKCLDVSGGGTGSGTPLQLWDCNGTGAQKFMRTSSGDLINTNSNKCVDVSNANPANGTRLQIWDCNGTPAQKWYPR